MTRKPRWWESCSSAAAASQCPGESRCTRASAPRRARSRSAGSSASASSGSASTIEMTLSAHAHPYPLGTYARIRLHDDPPTGIPPPRSYVPASMTALDPSNFAIPTPNRRRPRARPQRRTDVTTATRFTEALEMAVWGTQGAFVVDLTDLYVP